MTNTNRQVRSSKNDSRDNKISGLYRLLAVVLALWALYGIIVWALVPGMNQRGLFGDMFGGINSLFAGLAFAGIIYTIFLQRDELALQRIELELTRKELRRAATAQEKSQKALDEQVSALLMSAKLNALNGLVDYYSTELNNITGNLDPAHRAREVAQRKIRTYLSQLEGLLGQIQ